MNEKFEIIVKTLPGLEQVLAEELAEIGAENIEKGIRMVSFEGDKEMMYKANFCLRTAIRVLKPIKKFKATTADEVYEAVKDFNWDEYMTDACTSYKGLHHSPSCGTCWPKGLQGRSGIP